MSSKDKKTKNPKNLGDFGFTYMTIVNSKKYKAEIG